MEKIKWQDNYKLRNLLKNGFDVKDQEYIFNKIAQSLYSEVLSKEIDQIAENMYLMEIIITNKTNGQRKIQVPMIRIADKYQMLK